MVITVTGEHDETCIEAAKPDSLRCQGCILKCQACIDARERTPCTVSAEKNQNGRLVKDPVCPALEQGREMFHLWRKPSNVRRSTGISSNELIRLPTRRCTLGSFFLRRESADDRSRTRHALSVTLQADGNLVRAPAAPPSA